MNDYIPPPLTLAPGASVWAYLRDSGGEAQEQSVKQQQDVISAYCQQHKLILARLFADEAKSAGSVIGRDNFKEMIAATAESDLQPDGLLIWNFARFARDLDDSSYYKALLRRQGIVIHSLTDPIPDGEWGRVVEVVIDIANAEKRRQTSRDVKRAIASNVRGGFMSGGFPPRGYRAEHVVIGAKRNGQPRIVSRLVEDPELWEDVKLAWRLRAEGKSYSEIQWATGGRIFKSKSCWPSFFENRTYLGIGKCGKMEVPNHHTAAVDQKTWDKVQGLRRAQGASKRRTGRDTTPSLLSSLAACMHCGDKIFYDTDSRPRKQRWPYYLCGRKRRYGLKSCIGRRINARKADEAITETVLNRILTPEYITFLLSEVQAQLSDDAVINNKAERLVRDIAKCERDIANLLELGMQFGAKSAGPKLLQREADLARLQAEYEQLENERASRGLKISQEVLLAVVNQWRNQIIDARGQPNILSLRNHLTRFVDKIELSYNSACIYYKYPVNAFTGNKKVPPWGHSVITGKAIVVTWR